MRRGWVRLHEGRGVVAMGRVAFAMLLLSLETFGQASLPNEGKASLVGAGGGSPAGITYATTAQNWTQTISSKLTAAGQRTARPPPVRPDAVTPTEARTHSPSFGPA